MDDKIIKKMKEKSKSKDKGVSKEKSKIQRRVYDEFSDCKSCGGTLYKKDGSPCKCKTLFILKNEFKKYNIGANFLGVNLNYYSENFSDMKVKVKKGINGKYLKIPFNCDKFTTYIDLYSKTFSDRLLDGKGFVLSGDCGCGKSSGLIYVMQELILQNYKESFKSKRGNGYDMFFIDTIELLDAIKDTWDANSPTQYESKKKLERIKNVELLVIDDLGAEYSKSMEWLISIFLKIIKGRVNKNLPTLMSSNLTPEELNERFSAEGKVGRLASVLTEKFEFLVVQNVSDVRNKIADETSLFDLMEKRYK